MVQPTSRIFLMIQFFCLEKRLEPINFIKSALRYFVQLQYFKLVIVPNTCNSVIHGKKLIIYYILWLL